MINQSLKTDEFFYGQNVVVQGIVRARVFAQCDDAKTRSFSWMIFLQNKIIVPAGTVFYLWIVVLYVPLVLVPVVWGVRMQKVKHAKNLFPNTTVQCHCLATTSYR